MIRLRPEASPKRMFEIMYLNSPEAIRCWFALRFCPLFAARTRAFFHAGYSCRGKGEAFTGGDVQDASPLGKSRPAVRIAIAEGLHAQALMQRADGQCGMGGSLEAIEVAVALHAGWPHPLALTPSCCPAWGVMS
jgi:hypothetical protein